jgi:DNA gyrase/topoisomerase IV subunit B
MAIKVKQKHEKEIVALDSFEAVRLRPGMYLGQVSIVEERIPIIRDGKLQNIEKPWSPGFKHLIVEILENALDEAKRMKGKMKNIHVTVNFDNNKVTITDEGGGFHKANSKHPKTKKNVVRTAMEDLHAGSNFIKSEKNILGTHGVGAAVVNILSKYFSCTTVNATSYVHYEWDDFKVVKEEKRGKTKEDKKGTTISFIPTPDVFPGFKWDPELLITYFSFKQFLISLDPKLKDLDIKVNFIHEGKKEAVSLIKNFLPEENILLKNNLGTILLWRSYENSTSVSFINGSQCIGIHQKIVNDWGNEYFKYNLAHHFYSTLISLDVPSELMRFGDQNKSKYDITRYEIEDLMIENFHSKFVRGLKNSDITKLIESDIEEKLYAENIRKIKKVQRTSKRKISHKYSASSKKKISLYITEGLSAAGSVKQARNSEIEGVYALKGKIKNTKKLSDLAENKEILEIMSILGIDPSKDIVIPNYENIIIAADEDPDGQHISALIVNFFHKWFPSIIKEGRLKKLVTPLVVCNYGKERKYFYSLQEFQKFASGKKLSNINYLKGLGSLSLEDWQWVMSNKLLFNIIEDRSSKKYLDIAFGDSSKKRKEWLEGK